MVKNKEGSALLWAIVLCFVLVIVVSGALGIAYIYEKRSIEGHAQIQACSSAQSIGEGLVAILSSGSSEEQDKLIPKDEDTPILITKVSFPEANVNMGEGSATITKLSDTTISIKASAIVMEQREDIVIVLMKQSNGWQVVQYDNEEKTP